MSEEKKDHKHEDKDEPKHGHSGTPYSDPVTPPGSGDDPGVGSGPPEPPPVDGGGK